MKGWFQTYFYVQNATAADHINLPPYSDVQLPAAQPHWSYDPWRSDNDTQVLADRIWELVSLSLTGRDLLMAWVSRRVIPLQRRPHKLCYLSGLRDPSRTAREVMYEEEVAKLASAIIDGLVEDDWDFGVPPYRRSNPPPQVCRS